MKIKSEMIQKIYQAYSYQLTYSNSDLIWAPKTVNKRKEKKQKNLENLVKFEFEIKYVYPKGIKSENILLPRPVISSIHVCDLAI